MKTILEEKGYRVDTAETGKEAIDKSKQGAYNLALIDVRLPDIEGTELLKAIENTTPNMVKVIVTGYPSLQNAITAVNNGADAYILKPFKVEKVLQTIDVHLRRQESDREYSEERVAEFIATRVKEIEETMH